MMKKVVKKMTLEQATKPDRDLEYWLSRPPEERVAAADFLRRQIHGDVWRMQKVVRIVKRGSEEGE